MALTRANLRLAIREALKSFYDVDTVGSGGIDISSVLLPVTNVNLYKIGDTLQIESELMKVQSIDENNEQLTVARAFNLSSASAHAALTEIKIIPELTDRMIDYAINSGISETYPTIWFNVLDTSLTTNTTTRQYAIPANFGNTNFIIEVEDENGNFQLNRDWFVSGQYIVFMKDFSENGLTIRIQGMGYQTFLSDDSTTLNLADEQAEFIKAAAIYELMEMRLGPRLKATEYAASVNDRAGQPNEMITMIQHYRNKMQRLKEREGRPLKSGFLSRPRR